MRVTILNGEPDAFSAFQRYIQEITQQLTASGHQVTTLDLREFNLKGCSGCFGCWLKTPGECTKLDDSALVCQSAINTDLLVLASPLTMGFTSELLKRAAEQLIPLLHPYIVIEGGEAHHRARYEQYPLFGLLLGAGKDSDAEDIEITTSMWARMARNLKSSLVFTAVSDRPAKEVAHELTAVA
jgi:multimeric flavodoxin WrbA